MNTIIDDPYISKFEFFSNWFILQKFLGENKRILPNFFFSFVDFLSLRHMCLLFIHFGFAQFLYFKKWWFSIWLRTHVYSYQPATLKHIMKLLSDWVLNQRKTFLGSLQHLWSSISDMSQICFFPWNSSKELHSFSEKDNDFVWQKL